MDGISAQDPLAGTGGGVSVVLPPCSPLIMTGGASAEYGGGLPG